MLPHKRACNDAVTLGNSTGQLDLPVNVTLTSLADLPLLKVLSYVPGTDLGAVARVCTRLYALTRGHWSVWRGKQACFSFKDHEGLLALLRVTPPSWESLEVCMADPKLRWDHKDIPDPDPKENYNVAKVIEGGRTLSLSLLSETLAVTVIQEFGQRRIKNLSIELLHDVRRRDLFFSSLHQATSLETINVKWSWPLSCEGWEPQSYRASSRWPQVLPRLHNVTLDYRGNHHAVFKHECRWLRLLIEAHSEQLRRVSLRSPEVMSLLEFCPSGLERLTVTPVEGMAEKLKPLLQGLRELEFVGRFSSKAGKELAVLLRAWPGPLVSLGLEHFPEEVVRALGSGALAGLKHLRLGDPLEVVAERALSTALPGLPSLTRLVLSAASIPGVLHEIPAVTPALNLLIVVCKNCYLCRPASTSAFESAFRDTALRSSTPLHLVGLSPRSCNVCSNWLTARHRTYGKHPSAEVASCATCAEARATCASMPAAATGVQYVCVGR